MERVYAQQLGLFRLPVVGIFEWFMVLPGTVLLAATALRMVQPRQYGPARTSWMIFEWAVTHVSRLGTATLFAGMPVIVVAVGSAALLRSWRPDHALRPDAADTLAA